MKVVVFVNVSIYVRTNPSTCLYNYSITSFMFLQNQRTALHIAVYRDNVLLVKELIKFGADVNATIVSHSYL